MVMALLVAAAGLWLITLLLAAYAAWHAWGVRLRLTARHPGRLLARLRGRTGRQGDLQAAAAAAVGLLLALSWLGMPPWLAAWPAALSAAVVPRGLARWRAWNARRRLREQLPQLAWQLASALRAGLSLTAASSRVAARSPEPAAGWMRRLAGGLQLGMDLKECLEADPLQGDEGLTLLRTGLLVQRDLGIDLAACLQSLSTTLGQEGAAAAEMRAATAEARTTAALVAALPVTLLLLLRISLPDQVRMLFDHPVGWAVLLLFAAAQGANLLLAGRILGAIR